MALQLVNKVLSFCFGCPFHTMTFLVLSGGKRTAVVCGHHFWTERRSSFVLTRQVHHSTGSIDLNFGREFSSTHQTKYDAPPPPTKICMTSLLVPPPTYTCTPCTSIHFWIYACLCQNSTDVGFSHWTLKKYALHRSVFTSCRRPLKSRQCSRDDDQGFR